jgi:hypothetical protein
MSAAPTKLYEAAIRGDRGTDCLSYPLPPRNREDGANVMWLVRCSNHVEQGVCGEAAAAGGELPDRQQSALEPPVRRRVFDRAV